MRHDGTLAAAATEHPRNACDVSRQVYKAMRRSVLPVAVKVVSGAVAKTEAAQVEFLREVAYLRSLLSPTIVQFQVAIAD